MRFAQCLLCGKIMRRTLIKKHIIDSHVTLYGHRFQNPRQNEHWKDINEKESMA